MKNEINSSIIKDVKRKTQETLMKNSISLKQAEKEKQQIKELNVNQISNEKSLNKNKKTQKNILKKKNQKKTNINSNETKTKINKNIDSASLFSSNNEEVSKNDKYKDIISDEKIKDKLKKDEQNVKKKDKNNSDISLSHIASDMDNSRGIIMKSYNMNIKKDLNLFNTLDIPSEPGIQIKNYKRNISPKPSKYINQLTAIKNQSSSRFNQEVLKSSKRSIQTNNKKNNGDKFEDILIPGNEFDEYKTIQTSNLITTKFPKLSSNPFMTKTEKKASILNIEKNQNISELKRNLNQNNFNYNKIDINPDNISPKKEKEFIHLLKTPKVNFGKSKSSTSNPDLSLMSNNIPIILSNSKKTLIKNNEFFENKNLENAYHKLLILAKRGDHQKFLEIFKQILSTQKNNININYKDQYGKAALHYACDEGNLKIVEIILNSDCDINIKNNNNQSPLHLSAKGGYFDISKKLIECGADLNMEDSEKNTPLHYVCQNDYIELLEFFLTKNPRIDKKNIYGKTPKDLAKNQDVKNLIDKYIKNNKLNLNENRDSEFKKNLKKNVILKINSENSLNIKTKSILKQKAEYEQKNKKYNLEKDKTNSSKNLKIQKDKNNLDLNISLNSSNNKTYKNCTLKSQQKNRKSKHKKSSDKENSQENSSINIHKEKNNSNIIFRSTNNINNNNININIYTTELLKRERPHTNIISFQTINNDNKNIDSIKIDESHHNDKKSTTTYNSRTKKKLERKSMNESRSKLRKKKELENITKNQKDSTNIKNLLNDSENINTSNNDNANKNFHFSSKMLQSTLQLFSKVDPKKKQTKLNSTKNVEISSLNNNNLNSSKTSSSKKVKFISKPDNKNHSNVSLFNTGKKNLNATTLPVERITPSNFICLAQLGKGSFGEVYLVQKKDSTEKYAMKVLRKEKILGQNLLKYALAERNVLSLSNHPFIVKLYYTFQTSTKLYFVMEYCPNGDLSRHLTFETRFKEPRAKYYICEIILALENLHKRDIIYRDLKPDNIVLDKEGHCKLTDFGLSKEGVKENDYTKSFCGSVAYLAPEMLNKKGHGKAVDWYLLGVLFYEMLVGMTPYFTPMKDDLFYNIEYGELKIPNFVTKETAELLKGLLERNPNKRLGGGGRDAEEIKEHPYFKDVDWKKVYDKKIKPPNFLNYTKNTIKYFKKPKLFADDNSMNITDDINNHNLLKGWSFINPA